MDTDVSIWHTSMTSYETPMYREVTCFRTGTVGHEVTFVCN